jgi:hypothetical protein
MLAVVKRADLTGTGSEVVRVLAFYDDDAAFDPAAYGDDVAVLLVAQSAIRASPDPATLDPNWRTQNSRQTVMREATSRIEDVFPEDAQRDSIMEVNDYMLQFGTDINKWSAMARQRKAEIDRCWNYIRAIRTAGNGMASAPLRADPTLDSLWPPRIGPYKPRTS